MSLEVLANPCVNLRHLALPALRRGSSDPTSCLVRAPHILTPMRAVVGHQVAASIPYPIVLKRGLTQDAGRKTLCQSLASTAHVWNVAVQYTYTCTDKSCTHIEYTLGNRQMCTKSNGNSQSLPYCSPKYLSPPCVVALPCAQVATARLRLAARVSRRAPPADRRAD